MKNDVIDSENHPVRSLHGQDSRYSQVCRATSAVFVHESCNGSRIHGPQQIARGAVICETRQRHDTLAVGPKPVPKLTLPTLKVTVSLVMPPVASPLKRHVSEPIEFVPEGKSRIPFASPRPPVKQTGKETPRQVRVQCKLRIVGEYEIPTWQKPGINGQGAPKSASGVVGRQSHHRHRLRVSARGTQCMRRVQVAHASRQRRSVLRPLRRASHAG
jgi:hypothetical protein